MGKIVHGLKKTRRYEIWCGMKKRCYNENAHAFERYGGRGIGVCPEWENDFKAFYDWAENNGYRKNLMIDRINNHGDYEPLNCRWVTNIINCNNAIHNRHFTFRGIKRTLREWSWATGIKYKTLRGRIDRGWKLEDTFTIPVGQKQINRKRDNKGQFIRKQARGE